MSLEYQKKTELGKKIDSHEFNFDPKAWDNLEELLDSQTLPEEKKGKINFFTLKILAVMILLIILTFVLFTNFDKKMPTVVVDTANSALSAEKLVTDNYLEESAGDPEAPIAGQAHELESVEEPPAQPILPRMIPVSFEIPFFPIPILPSIDSSLLPVPAGKMTALNERLSPEKVYLQFDKTYYKPGETVWFNAYVRDANTLRPSDKSDFLHVEFLKPNGGILRKIKINAEGGIAAGDFLIPPEVNGGLYKIKAYTNWQRNENAFFEKEITIRKNVLPNLRMQLDFMKKSYGVGDEVVAAIELKTLANAFLESHDFTADVMLDGTAFKKIKGKTDKQGKAKIQFRLPEKLSSNSGMLNVLISYNGQTESIARPIPILLNKIDLQFFPEGGDLIAGFPTKIAFKAIDEFGKPADIQGLVLNESGATVGSFESFHDGMGSFDFTPEPEVEYSAKITRPKSVGEIYDFPKVNERGFSFNVEKAEKSDVLNLKINTREPEDMSVVVRSAGEIRYWKRLSSFQRSLSISTAAFPVGIAQVTLFDSKDIPRAERLVFLNADRVLNVKIDSDKEKYLPREKITLSVEVTDERGLGIPGQFSLAVADDKLLSYADDKQGHILSSLLLESELKGKIHEPNFYFEEDDTEPAKSRAIALDYLMMTHGWRRFDWESVLTEQKVAEARFKSEKSEISGQVLDKKNKPFVGAEVVLQGLAMKTKTDNDGRFVFDNISYLPANSNIRIFTPKASAFVPISGFDTNIRIDLRDPKWTGGTSLSGKVVDEETQEPLLFANVAVYKNGNLVTGVQTDFDGFYGLANIDPGSYDVEVSYSGYASNRLTGVAVFGGRANKVDLHLSSGVALEEVIVTAYKVPLINQDETTSGGTLTSDQLKKLPTRNIAAITSNVAGISTGDEGDEVYMKGSRSGSEFYMVDGIRVQGGLIPEEEIEAELPILGGTPAQFSNTADRTTKDVIASVTNEMADMWEEEELPQIDPRLFGGTYRSIEQSGINFSVCTDVYGADKQQCIKSQLNQFLYSELNYPLEARKKGVSGTVMVNTSIDKDGKVTYTSIGKSLRSDCDKEAMRVVGLLPKIKIDETNQSNFPSIVQIPVEFNQVDYLSRLTVAGIYTPRKFYVPKYEAEEMPSVRNDFRETIYWNPSVKTDRNGQATIEFYASDAVTTFKATLEGIGITGEVGRGTGTFYTQLPFGMAVKMPANLVEGDLIKVPVSLSNHTGEKVSGKITVTYPESFEPAEALPSRINMQSGEQKTIFLPFRVKNSAVGKEHLQVEFQANGLRDGFVREVKISPRGFPVSEVFSGNELEKSFELNVVNPVSGSVRAEFAAHPSPVSDLVSGLDRMLRQPNGCFEQTSSSNYPNLLAINYLRESGENQPEIEKRGKDFLKKGYNRLKTFEVDGGGFDWYGRAPAHEGLTAYGLMQFEDMKAVFDVEQSLINRTADWLMSRRDGQGGWLKKQKSMHRWLMSDEISNGYIVWALSEAGYGKKLKPEIEKSLKDARSSEDSYLLALAANTMLNTKDKRAGDLLKRLSEFQAADGSFTGKTTSIVGSRGKNLTIETTGLAAMAMMKNGKKSLELEKAIDYLAGAKSQYGFGSTQATVLAMKALVKYAIFSKRTSESGVVALYLDGDKIAEEKYDAERSEPIIFEDLEKYIRNGKRKLEVKFSKTKTALPYDFSLKYSTIQPLNSEACRVNLQTDLRTSKAKQGENIRFDISLKNTTNEALSNTIAIIGIPAGVSTRPKQLKKMQDETVYDFYEILPNGYIAFHFRSMAPNELKKIPLELKADVNGEFESPASVAYLYYENDLQFWSKPEKVTIK